MKISSSDILFQSNSKFTLKKDETLYSFSADGQFLNKRQKSRTEQSETIEQAHFKTGEAYVLETRNTADKTRVGQGAGSGNSSLTGEDDLEKRIYLKSVLDWAANTIDGLVTAFEEKRSGHQQAIHQQVGENPESEGTDFQAEPAGENMQNHLYRAMAEEFRAKAQALLPDLPGGRAANRVRRVSGAEKETTLVQAAGKIHTADGREIEFSLDVSMHREATYETVETFRVVDPLVINFQGTHAQLGEGKILFDLDQDGVAEEMAELGAGSGFLALDINGDGKVNNGGELFGPSSGNGFKELSYWDSDNNMWIDENDPIYDKLSMWIRDKDKNDVLVKLSEAGIAAIHLGAVKSNFLMKDSKGNSVGRIAGTGIALTEDEVVKTVQQVDMIV